MAVPLAILGGIAVRLAAAALTRALSRKVAQQAVKKTVQAAARQAPKATPKAAPQGARAAAKKIKAKPKGCVNGCPTASGSAKPSKPLKAGKRPSWQASEKRAHRDVGPSYKTQQSFKNGKPVKYGTKGSTRPDLFKTGRSVEVKNYEVSSSAGRQRLVRNVSEQVKRRAAHLPSGTRQSIRIDVRGQNVSTRQLRDLKGQIIKQSGGKISPGDIIIVK